MQCEVCNRSTSINWGGSQHVLCEQYYTKKTDGVDGNLLSSSADSERLSAKFAIIFFVVIELILLPAWWGLFILSTPGSGSSDYFIMMAPFAGYPVFVIVFLLLALRLYKNKKRYLASVLSIVMPLVISFGYLTIILGVME